LKARVEVVEACETVRATLTPGEIERLPTLRRAGLEALLPLFRTLLCPELLYFPFRG